LDALPKRAIGCGGYWNYSGLTTAEYKAYAALFAPEIRAVFGREAGFWKSEMRS
jgi:hypothetical protein